MLPSKQSDVDEDVKWSMDHVAPSLENDLLNRLSDRVSWVAPCNQRRTELVLTALCLLGLMAFFIYEIVRFNAEAENPFVDILSDRRQQVRSPGIVLCADRRSGYSIRSLFDTANPKSLISCGLRHDKSKAVSCNETVRHVDYEFNNLQGADFECQTIPPGFIANSSRDLVEIAYAFVVNRSAPYFYFSSFNILYYGLYSSVENMGEAEVFAVAGGGQSAITYQIEERVSVSGSVERKYVTQGIQYSGLLENGRFVDLVNKSEVYYGLIYLAPKMDVTVYQERVGFTAWDIITSFGGAISLILGINSLLVGEGAYKRFGLLHKLWDDPKPVPSESPPTSPAPSTASKHDVELVRALMFSPTSLPRKATNSAGSGNAGQ